LTADGRYRLRSILSLGIAILVLALAIFYWSELMQAISKISIPWVLAGSSIYMLNYALRALRLKFISNHQIRWWPEGLYASCAHGFTTYIIPFRAGDLALPLILQSVTPFDLAQGSRILVRARLLDAQTLGLWILIAAVTANFPMARALQFAWFTSGIILLIAPWAIKFVQQIGFFHQFSIVQKASVFFTEEPQAKYSSILSVAIWLAIAGCYFCAARAVGLDLSPMQVWLLITIQLPLQLLPIQGVASTGAHEGGWVAALLLLGVPMSSAVEFALTSHVVIIIYVLMIGLLATCFSQFCKHTTIFTKREEVHPMLPPEDEDGR